MTQRLQKTEISFSYICI